MNSESLCAPGDRPEKQREGERERETGTRALMEQRCFNQHGVGIYILSYKVVILSKDTDKIPDLQNIGDPY